MFPIITGFASKDIENQFVSEMTARIKHFDRWNLDSIKSELFSRIEDQLSSDESLDYELSQFDTLSGHTELISFDKSEFCIEWRDE